PMASTQGLGTHTDGAKRIKAVLFRPSLILTVDSRGLPDGRLEGRPCASKLDYFSTANASSTFPGNPPRAGYPDTAKIIPPATTGPATSIAPPLPGMPLTVW